MTSNLGNEIIAQASPPVEGDTKAAVMEELRNYFRPELINRLDEIVVFDRLTHREIRKVVDIQIELVRTRLANREIDLELSDDAKDLLAQQGYDPAYGARPLRRVIQRSVLDQLAEQILAGNLTDGMLVRVNAVNGSLVFEPVAQSEAEAA
jgi:ATP-dependent Clp protease ATP-binding subunit ClpB